MSIHESLHAGRGKRLPIFTSAVLLLATLVAPSTALAQKEITLTIERVKALDCLDEIGLLCGSDADFYAEVGIGDAAFTTGVELDDDDITPGWKFRKIVPDGVVDVHIEIWDEDDINADDHVDVTSNAGRTLNLNVDVDACTITGEATGNCGATIVSTGNDDDNADLEFRVDVGDVRLGEVEVWIERLQALDCFDDVGCTSEADFYAKVAIDTFRVSNLADADEYENEDDIAPYWRFHRFVNLARNVIPIDITIMDRDINPDDVVDVNPSANRTLHIELDPGSCDLSGDVSGRCGSMVDAASRIKLEGSESVNARLQLRVQRNFPPMLEVKCLHYPIWPMEDEEVKIQARVMTPDGKTINADSIAITQTQLALTSTCTQADVCELETPPSQTPGVFSYECNATHLGESITSGTREFTIGSPSADVVVPIWTQRPVNQALDLVFIPDKRSYTSAEDPAFRLGVHGVINNGFLMEEVIRRRQDRFNFWISRDLGEAHGFSSGAAPCHSVPGSFSTSFAFAETGIILHKQDLRNCANNDVFTSQNYAIKVVLHESGHTPFGLKDEYCCDGGYSQTGSAPNLYGPETPGTTLSQDACFNDPLAKLPDSCRSFESEGGDTWFRLDHAPAHDAVDVENDLMIDNRIPRAADERRMQKVINDLP
jgi:hypothetical protein